MKLVNIIEIVQTKVYVNFKQSRVVIEQPIADKHPFPLLQRDRVRKRFAIFLMLHAGTSAQPINCEVSV